MAIVGGTFLGVMTARKPDGFFSNVVTVFSLVGYSSPVLVWFDDCDLVCAGFHLSGERDARHFA